MQFVETGSTKLSQEQLLLNIERLEQQTALLSLRRLQQLQKLAQGPFAVQNFGVFPLDDNRYAFPGPGRTPVNEYTIWSLRQNQVAELEAVSQFLQRLWGVDHPEATGTELITILDMGGMILAAYDQSQNLIGASQLLAGTDGQLSPALIDDQVGVLSEHRGVGLGKVFKHVAFERMLAGGVTRMYTTFDPKRANLWGLNVGRLGAKVVEFVENKYGQAGLTGEFNEATRPTDRVVGVYDLIDPLTIHKACGLSFQHLLPQGADRITERLDMGDEVAAYQSRARVLSDRLRDYVAVEFTRDQELIFIPKDEHKLYQLRQA